MDSLDNGKELFNYRLYREHTSRIGNIKDLSLLGRDLSKVIIVDNLEENFSAQNSNGLKIVSWEGNIYDNELKGLMDILIGIYEYKVEDVRNVVNAIKLEMKDCFTNSFGDINITRIIV